MTPSALATSADGFARADRRSLQLDVFRGVAAMFMVVNHAGFQLLGPGAVDGGWPTWLVFIGSAAPALFFFATGVGSGLASGNVESAASALRKIVLLLLADALLHWSAGHLLGLDFFGFTAISMATMFVVRRAGRAERVATVLLLLVLLARFGLAPVLHGRIANDSLLAFMTGNAVVPHVSYPLGPWLAFPLLGFLLGRRWRAAGASEESWIVGVTAVLGLALYAVLAINGAPVFRWSSVSLAYFLCAVGIVATVWLVAGAAACALPTLAQRATLRGPASLLIVPLHYGLLGLLEAASAPPWDVAAWAPATLVLVLVVFVVSRALVASARRMAVPGPSLQGVVALFAAGVGLASWYLAPPLLRLEVCSAGQVVIALLLLWSSNKPAASRRAATDTPTVGRA